MRFATDKVSLGYLPAYLRIAAEIGTAGRVCEVGVRGGHGLDMFQALFPDGIITGVDWDAECRWPDGTIRIVSEQDAPDLAALLTEHSPAWDLVIDDASHEGELTRATFGLLWPLVAPGGFYVVEDWQTGLDSWAGTGPGMLHAVQRFLELLDKGSDVEEITCRYGMAVLRKKA